MKKILQAKIAHNYGYEVENVELINVEWRIPGIWVVIVLIVDTGEYAKIKIHTSNWQMHAI